MEKFVQQISFSDFIRAFDISPHHQARKGQKLVQT